VNALANDEVGEYLNSCFVATFQKVGTFTVNGARKKGGNVASYFCTPEGRVLHALAGPVNATVLLREARWAVESSKLAALDGARTDARLRAFYRKAHAERLKREHGMDLGRSGLSARLAKLDKQGRIHHILMTSPLPRLELLYKVVFEKILGEKVSTSPVVEAGG
jgi:hypothetical protein